MKLALTLVIALAACGGKSSDSKTTPSPTPGQMAADDMVDPTLPSWAPKSCKGYHTVVVKAVDCTEIDQASRDQIKSKYEASDTAWHNLQNATQAQIDEIAAACKTDHDHVHDTAAGKCGITM